MGVADAFADDEDTTLRVDDAFTDDEGTVLRLADAFADDEDTAVRFSSSPSSIIASRSSSVASSDSSALFARVPPPLCTTEGMDAIGVNPDDVENVVVVDEVEVIVEVTVSISVDAAALSARK